MKILCLFIILTVTAINGCSSVQLSKTFSNNSYINIDNKLNHWQLEEAESEARLISDSSVKKYYIKQINKKKIQFEDLNSIFKDIETNLNSNNIIEIKKYIDRTLVNELKFNEIMKYDLSQTDIILGEKVMFKDKCIAIVAINYLEETVYIEIILRLTPNKWKIIDFYEKE